MPTFGHVARQLVDDACHLSFVSQKKSKKCKQNKNKTNLFECFERIVPRLLGRSLLRIRIQFRHSTRKSFFRKSLLDFKFAYVLHFSRFEAA